MNVGEIKHIVKRTGNRTYMKEKRERVNTDIEQALMGERVLCHMMTHHHEVPMDDDDDDTSRIL